MVHVLAIGASEHLVSLLLCSALVEALIGGEKGNGQLVKRVGGKRREKQG